jgi:hypothetical protein
MGDLQKIALEFCRDCLGWEDAYYPEGITHSCFTRKMGVSGFRYSNFEVVMDAVRGCFPKSRIVLEIQEDRSSVFIHHGKGGDGAGESQTGEPLTYCLMRAAIYSKQHINRTTDSMDDLRSKDTK